MKNVSGFPYSELAFDKQARLVKAAAAADAEKLVDENDLTDLLVISHGWNNDSDDASKLYKALLKSLSGVLPSLTVMGSRRLGVLAVFWPSKKFADEELIPGGAASLGSIGGRKNVEKMLDSLKGVFDDGNADVALKKAKALVARLESSPEARREFVTLIRSILEPPKKKENDSDGSDLLFKTKPEEVLDRISSTGIHAPGAGGGGGAGGAAHIGMGIPAPGPGGAAGLGDLFGGILSGARNLLNFATYYQMKKRAGIVGEHGLNPVLRKLRKRFPDLRIHLVGHSFGGRVVTAAASGPAGEGGVVCETMTLLQAAFSHYGLAQDYDGKGSDGAFRAAVAGARPRVKGPVIITCTKNDKAVGIAYAIASRLAGQQASALGDENDWFGGIGRNGARRTPEAKTEGRLLDAGKVYEFAGQKIHNLRADSFIASHSDITGKQVAWAILSAVATT